MVKVTFGSRQHLVRIVTDTRIVPQIREGLEGPGIFQRCCCLNLCLKNTSNVAPAQAEKAQEANLKRRTSMFGRWSH